MTPREHLLRCYRRQGVEQALPSFHLCPSLAAEFHRRYGKDADYAEAFGFASRGVWLPPAPRAAEPEWKRWYAEPLAEGTTFDLWGIAHEPGSSAAMHMTRMHHPLKQAAAIADFQAYPWPDWQGIDEAALRRQVEAIHARGLAAEGHMACTVWETAWYLRSMEALMQDMCEDHPRATWLLDAITGFSAQRAAAYARAGIDVLCLGDDVGTQSRLMMSRPMYRRWLMPRLAEVIRAARAAKPDIVVLYHSCGHVTGLIPDLIEAGIDVLNPVQPESMDFASLHRDFGSRLSFNGTLGTQTTLPFGTADEVAATVHRHLDLAGRAGGLLCCPTHLVEPEVPWANLEAYVQACREHAFN